MRTPIGYEGFMSGPHYFMSNLRDEPSSDDSSNAQLWCTHSWMSLLFGILLPRPSRVKKEMWRQYSVELPTLCIMSGPWLSQNHIAWKAWLGSTRLPSSKPVTTSQINNCVHNYDLSHNIAQSDLNLPEPQYSVIDSTALQHPTPSHVFVKTDAELVSCTINSLQLKASS